MDKSYVIPVLTELRELRAKTHKFTDWSTFIKLTEDDCKFILSRAIELIKVLDGALEECEENREHFRALAISRNKELEELQARHDELKKELSNWKDLCHDWQREAAKDYEKSNQLEKRCSELVKDRDIVVEYWEEKNRKITTKFELAKKFLHQRREEVSRLEEELRQTQLVKDAQKKVIDEKEKQVSDLHHEIWELQEQAEYWEDLAKKIADQNGCDITSCYPRSMINNPQNFCGNCRHYAQMGKDDDEFEGICTQHYIKRVDPDDASCSHFESNQVDRDKPDQPCCKACNRDDCGDCTLCPF